VESKKEKRKTKTKQTKVKDIENRLVVARVEGWGWEKQLKRVQRYKLLIINNLWGYNVQHVEYN